MATSETSGTFKFKDSNGNIVSIYPTTLKENVSGMGEIDNHVAASKPIDMASTDGVNYTCSVPGLDTLVVGANFVGVPQKESTSQAVKLDVNGLGSKFLRRRVSVGSATTAAGYTNDWIAANKPIRIIYDGLFWIVDDIVQPNANDLMGSVPITKGGTGASNGATGLANLLAAGSTVLSANQYGDKLPAAGTPGRIFYKPVNIAEVIYPVGAIYISTVSTNPADLFGFGTWEQIKDVFLLSAGTTYTAGSTGGEATHTPMA